MFYILSKILYYFLMPLSWVIYTLLYALFTKNIKKRRISLRISVALLLFFGNGFLVNEAYLLWEVRPISIPAHAPPYDVAIVLTGDIATTNNWLAGRPSFGRGSDRLWQAASLYKKGKVKKILISGGSGDVPGVLKSINEGQLAFNYLRQVLQIDSTAILLEGHSRNTHENAVNSAAILKKHYPNGGRFLLCTSAFHMRRSAGCFQKAGVVVTNYSTDIRSYNREITLDNFYPREQPLFQWQVLMREWVGYVTYKLMGYS